MSTQTVLINYIQQEFVRGRKELQPQDDLLNTGILNSLGILKLVSFIEDRFNIQIPDEDILFENFQSVHRLSSYLENR